MFLLFLPPSWCFSSFFFFSFSSWFNYLNKSKNPGHIIIWFWFMIHKFCMLKNHSQIWYQMVSESWLEHILTISMWHVLFVIGPLINISSHVRDIYISAWESAFEVSHRLEINQFIIYKWSANLTLQVDFVGWVRLKSYFLILVIACNLT